MLLFTLTFIKSKMYSMYWSLVHTNVFILNLLIGLSFFILNKAFIIIMVAVKLSVCTVL